jgi:hypothetical protein
MLTLPPICLGLMKEKKKSFETKFDELDEKERKELVGFNIWTKLSSVHNLLF